MADGLVELMEGQVSRWVDDNIASRRIVQGIVLAKIEGIILGDCVQESVHSDFA